LLPFYLVCYNKSIINCPNKSLDISSFPDSWLGIRGFYFKSMANAKCYVCKEEKPLSEFSKNGDKPGSMCKECHKEYARKHYLENKSIYTEARKRRRIKLKEGRRTDFGLFLLTMYMLMTRRAKSSKFHSRAYGKQLLSREEFTNLAMADNSLKGLFDKWVESGYERRLCPTPDRLDNSKGYELGNIQFITQSANATKGNYEKIGKVSPDYHQRKTATQLNSL
jgi:hypothetical protein